MILERVDYNTTSTLISSPILMKSSALERESRGGSIAAIAGLSKLLKKPTNTENVAISPIQEGSFIVVIVFEYIVCLSIHI